MKCPMCYTITDEFKSKVNRQFMDLGLFRKLVDQCARRKTYSIRISLRGEPFMHRDVIAMIKYAKKKGIREVSSLTNNLAMTPSLFKEAMEAGLDWLTISFDGLGKTYERIRQPAKFEESYGKIKEYKRIKEQSRSRKPVIKFQSVWRARTNNAKEYFDAFDRYVDNIAVNPLVDYLLKDRVKDILHEEKFICPALYQRLVIGADGIALLCPNDEFYWHTIGDANKESLYDIWHGKRMREARRINRRHEGVKDLKPCRHCYLPRKTKPSVEAFGGRNIIIDKYVNRPDEVGK
jgi:MoaA/NifB/PqqE/SkfB family radical SAM enzyme